jgi:hypothetical protein
MLAAENWMDLGDVGAGFRRSSGGEAEGEITRGTVVSGEITSADRVTDQTGISRLNCAPVLLFGCWEILSFSKGEKCGLLDMAYVSGQFLWAM